MDEHLSKDASKNGREQRIHYIAAVEVRLDDEDDLQRNSQKIFFFFMFHASNNEKSRSFANTKRGGILVIDGGF